MIASSIQLDSEGELCDSDSLDNARRADKESELSSILNHPMLTERCCQLWAGVNSCSDRFRRAPERRAERGDFGDTIEAGARSKLPKQGG